MRMAAAMLAALVSVTLPARAALTPNAFEGSDSDRIEAAIRCACETGERSVAIPRVNKGRKEAVWLIDRAILLPDDFTLVLDDCLVRLAPGTRDNIIRNAGATPEGITTNRNIAVVGVGRPVLSGGLAAHFDPPGDRSGWRTIGVLLCAVRGFRLEGFTLQETQAWGVSVENGCCGGRIANLVFDDSNRIPNQDGVDVRKGCHDILIENISGRVGDDAVALTGLRGAVADSRRRSMQIGGDGPTADDDIHDIIVRNVRVTCAGGHGIVRLLNHDGVRLHDVVVRDVVDTASAADPAVYSAVRIGDLRYSSIRRAQAGETRNILVDGVFSKGRAAVRIDGPLQDSVIRNVFTPDAKTPKFAVSVPVERVIME